MSEYTIKVISESENKLLNRKEIEFEILHTSNSTPKRLEIKKKIAAQFNKEEELTIIKKLDTKYGIGMSTGKARIYNNMIDVQNIEPSYLIKRNSPKEEKEEE
ncbi:MAG: 30S ribosomal protein S24e [Candidatus Lokiarchaeota archaeon]|nr:30S ribosomal protein S24e [Candidatus Lokiarchaeota archaeon]